MNASRGLASLLAAALLCWSMPGTQAAVDEASRVREAMLATYFHGVDDLLAAQVVGEAGLPHLRVLLRDESFPRRDNVVAFLAHLDRGEATSELLRILSDPPGDPAVPEEDRALLIAPQALGRIASRGDRTALEALLEMTADRSDGGPLRRAASRAPRPLSMKADLMEMALRGLAFSGSPRARTRLADLLAGRVRPETVRDLAPAARTSLELFDQLYGGGASGPAMPPHGGSLGSPAPLAGPPGAAGAGENLLSGGGASLTDTSSRTNQSPLTYANHVAVGSPMNNTRLDECLADSNLRLGRSESGLDVACCVSVVRSGSALSFGTAGDGLDMIDSSGELNAVLNHPVSRVKVVRGINWCGSPGTNIIGCAWIAGNGMSLVRLSDLGSEGILWVHEYGHNVGLNHSTTPGAIMQGFLSPGNNLVQQGECNAFHTPDPGAGMVTVDTGVCADSDADGVHNVQDNCPFVANFNQADFDADGQGDVCDGDGDSDGVLDVNDCAALDPQIWAVPSEPLGLELEYDVGLGILLSWSPPTVPGGTAASLRYDVISSTLASDFLNDAVCVETNDGPDPSANSSGPPTPIWTTEGDQPGAKYGVAVSTAGDFNNDGFDDVLVGATDHDNGQDNEGRLSLYFGSIAGPGAVTRVELNNDLARFGAAVSSAGNVNGDVYDDVIAGAPGYDDGVVFGGVAVAYHGSPAGLVGAPVWTVSSDAADASFGAAVGGGGDVNGDFYDDVIVGAPGYTASAFGEGRAFVYLGSASGLDTSAVWSPTGTQLQGHFGASVRVVGDLNQDGFDDVAVGAPEEENGEDNEGRVHIYLGGPTGPSASPVVILEGGQIGAAFGASVAGPGDVNGDGHDDLLVGAPQYDNGQSNEGRAYLFLGTMTGVETTPVWTAEINQVNAQLGSSVAGAGDMNADGLDDVVIAARLFDGDLTDEGRVYVHMGAPSGVTAIPVIVVEGNQGNAGFGVSVAGAGRVRAGNVTGIIVGSNLFDGGMTDEGRAQVYMGSPTLQPAAGEILYYLVRARNGCGSSPAGRDSQNVVTPARTCP